MSLALVFLWLLLLLALILLGYDYWLHDIVSSIIVWAATIIGPTYFIGHKSDATKLLKMKIRLQTK